ncbi:MAG: zinc ribbon domain-containing protein [Planctomycetota bacterium]|jgi:ribosomal protein L40E
MSPKRKRPVPTFPCPNCGADVKRGALACRECGSDDLTGWSDETAYDDLDLPDPDRDWWAEEQLAQRAGAAGLPTWVVWTALATLLGVVLFALR